MRLVEKRVLRSKIYLTILLVSIILKSTFIFFKRHVRYLGAEVTGSFELANVGMGN